MRLIGALFVRPQSTPFHTSRLQNLEKPVTDNRIAWVVEPNNSWNTKQLQLCSCIHTNANAIYRSMLDLLLSRETLNVTLFCSRSSDHLACRVDWHLGYRTIAQQYQGHNQYPVFQSRQVVRLGQFPNVAALSNRRSTSQPNF
jgi:hypothetical protein